MAEKYEITNDELSQLAGVESELEDARATIQSVWEAVGGRPVTPEEPEEPEEPEPGPRLTAGISFADNDRITIGWTVTTPVAEIATIVVGRDGQDDTGYGAWSGNPADDAVTVTFDKLRPNTRYNVFVQITWEDGVTERADFAVTTSADPVVEPPPVVGRQIPRVGRSGTGTNIVLFKSGVDTPAQIEAWEGRYGVKVDGLMRFAFRDSGEAGLLNEEFWAQCGAVAATGRLMIIAIPFGPASDGSGMNRKAASGGYNGLWVKIAALIKKYQLDKANVVIRLGWEFNGNWYAWSTTDANGGAAAFKSGWAQIWNTVQGQGCKTIRWALCGNKGGQSNNAVKLADVWNDGMVDVGGVDHYNFWPAQTNAASFAQAASQNPGLRPNMVTTRAKGVMWSIDEGGPANPAGTNYGGDHPYYPQAMIEIVAANKADNAWFMIYDDKGAPESLNHAFESNPNYKNAILGAIRTGW